eukprot:3307220-Lingulodinium_polyedra.AAC.1
MPAFCQRRASAIPAPRLRRVASYAAPRRAASRKAALASSSFSGPTFFGAWFGTAWMSRYA